MNTVIWIIPGCYCLCWPNSWRFSAVQTYSFTVASECKDSERYMAVDCLRDCVSGQVEKKNSRYFSFCPLFIFPEPLGRDPPCIWPSLPFCVPSRTHRFLEADGNNARNTVSIFPVLPSRCSLFAFSPQAGA